MESLLKIREKIAMLIVEKTKPLYVALFKRSQKAWQKSNTMLCKYPKGSLGRKLGTFLSKNKFELLPKLEDHDVFHVLLDYKPTLVGEIKMQCFLLGNRKRSIYALLSALTGVILVPEKFSAFKEAFRRGRKCAPVFKWNFEYLLAEPLKQLRKQILKQNTQQAEFQNLIF